MSRYGLFLHHQFLDFIRYARKDPKLHWNLAAHDWTFRPFQHCGGPLELDRAISIVDLEGVRGEGALPRKLSRYVAQ